ncbi:advillin-like [Amphibalanus amphitrite]|uniref:advillin-like n=1 Tax=Amphibalanus amphitrite TaxID=1232801 RepID=UPI001C90C9A9|nr:advillin-like [Amphibalanus amphitrite]
MAATDPAFRAVPRRAPCFLVWRVEQLVLVPVPRDQYGRFHRGDSYVVLHCGERGAPPSARVQHAPGPLETHIHFWLGSETSADEAGVAAYKTVELDELLGGGPVQHREIEGSESARFRAYFPAGLRILAGGAAAGLTHVGDKFEPALYAVKGRRHPVIRQLPAVSWEYVNDGDVFVLDAREAVFVWTGKQANPMEKIQAARLAQSLKGEHGGGEVVIVESGQEGDLSPAERALFGRLLPLKDRHVQPAAAADSDERHERRRVEHLRLYRCSDHDGSLMVMEVKSGPLLQSDLDSNDSFIVDNGEQGIWVWVGKRASHKERAEAMRNAQGFIKKKGYAPSTAVTRVIDGGEPSEFKTLFKSWRDRHAAVGLGKTAVSGKLAPPIQTSFDAATLHENRALAAQTQMLDDGSGEKEVWRVHELELTPVERAEHGTFLDGDCYLVLYRYRAGGAARQVLYYWLGGRASQLERGQAALKTVELDDRLGGRPVQVRVVQGREPPHFMVLFGGRLVVLTGSGGAPSSAGPRLLQVRGAAQGGTRAVQVPLAAASLNSGDCFVLHEGVRASVWCGRGATGDERESAKKLAGELCAEPSVMYEGQEPASFWATLGGRAPYAGERPASSEQPAHPPRLFHCSDAGGRFSVGEVVSFEQADLVPQDVMLLDAWDAVFIWIGAESNATERRQAEHTALEYLRTDPAGRGTDTPIITVHQGAEPPTFTGFFGPWSDELWRTQPDWETVRRGLAAENGGLGRVSPEAAAETLPVYAFSQLNVKEAALLPRDVDPAVKERYLSPAEFRDVFGMTLESFSALPGWKRQQLKKKVGLF